MSKILVNLLLISSPSLGILLGWALGVHFTLEIALFITIVIGGFIVFALTR